MADIIEKNLKVELGQLIKVNNLEKKANENDIYVALQVEDEDGGNERCLLFTEIEVSDMQKIKAEFLNELVDGRIYKFFFNGRQTNIIKIKNSNKQVKFLRVSNTQLAKAEKRAKKNQEDLTKKGIFTDLID